jgi:hypothetical protein
LLLIDNAKNVSHTLNSTSCSPFPSGRIEDAQVLGLFLNSWHSIGIHGGMELIGRGTSVDLSEFSERNSKYRAIFQAAGMKLVELLLCPQPRGDVIFPDAGR